MVINELTTVQMFTKIRHFGSIKIVGKLPVFSLVLPPQDELAI